MARFDVHRMADGDYVLDCQADWFRHLNTRLVIPLQRPDAAPIPAQRLNPTFIVEDETVVMVTQYATAVAERQLGPRVMSLAEHDSTIMAAIDMLLTGY